MYTTRIGFFHTAFVMPTLF